MRGWAANSLEKALEMLEQYNALREEGDAKVAEVEGVILVLDRVMPDIVSHMPSGIHLLARKLSVHAVSLAQHSGMTVVAEVPEDQMYKDPRGYWVVGGAALLDGTLISLDGHRNPATHNTSGHVYHGSLDLKVPGSKKALVQGGVDLTQVRERTNLSLEGDNIRFEHDPVLARRLKQADGLRPIVVGMYKLGINW